MWDATITLYPASRPTLSRRRQGKVFFLYWATLTLLGLYVSVWWCCFDVIFYKCWLINVYQASLAQASGCALHASRTACCGGLPWASIRPLDICFSGRSRSDTILMTTQYNQIWIIRPDFILWMKYRACTYYGNLFVIWFSPWGSSQEKSSRYLTEDIALLTEQGQ